MQLELYLRRTFDYDGGWASLDEHTYLCTARIPAPRIIEEGDGISDGGVYHYTIKVPRQLSRKDHARIKRAIYHTIGGSNCQHEHDCCGCTFRSVSVQRTSLRTYSVRVSSWRNY